MINNKRINLGLLMKLVSVQSKSHNDEAMQEFIKSIITSMKLQYTEDDYGNIYVIKGKAKSYPCIVAHTDTVHDIVKDYRVFKMDSLIFAMDGESGRQVGTGGDDKCGIYAAFNALKYYKNVKVVFYRNEEVGHLGSHHSITNNKEFYKDCNFVIVADRKGNGDFITKSGGHDICSKAFITACTPYLQEHEFKKTTGVSCDVDTLVYEGIGISCVNISSGYWRPHTSSEIIDIDDLQSTIDLIDDIVENLGHKRFEFKYTKPVATNNNTWSSYRQFFGRYNLSKRLTTFEARYRRIVIRDSKAFDVVVPRVPTSISPKTELMFAPKDLTMPIRLHKDAKCTEKSKIKHSIVYLMEEDIFFCLRCQTPVSDSDMIDKFYKEMTIKEKGNEFVYDSFNNIWLKKSDAVWKERQRTYLAKSVQSAWAD